MKTWTLVLTIAVRNYQGGAHSSVKVIKGFQSEEEALKAGDIWNFAWKDVNDVVTRAVAFPQ